MGGRMNAVQGGDRFAFAAWFTRALAAAALLFASAAPSQEFPQRPIRILVAYSAGAPPDIAARVLAAHMTGTLGQSVVVENKPGAIGVVAMTELLKQPADGYNLLTMLVPVISAPALLKGVKIDPVKDFEAVAQYTWSYSVLVTSPASPINTVNELVAAIRARPAAFSFASGGHGTPAHLAGELFNQTYQVDAVHVPYNQFPQAIADLASGRVSYMFLTTTVAVPNVKGGKLKAIGVAANERLAALPQVPTLAEQGFRDFDVRAWDGLVVRAGTPRPVIDRLNRAVNAAVAAPEVRERLGSLGLDVVAGTPQQYAELIRRDTERFSALIRARNITAE